MLHPIIKLAYEVVYWFIALLVKAHWEWSIEILELCLPFYWKVSLSNSAMNCFPNLGPKFSDWIHWHEFKGHRSLKRNNSMQKSSYVRRRHPLLTSQEVLVPIEVRANLWGGNVITVVWGELNYWALVGGIRCCRGTESELRRNIEQICSNLHHNGG